jgi:hypothetical protein
VVDVRHVVAAVLFLVKGIIGLFGDARDFGSLEERVHQLVQEASRMVFVWVLEELDEKLCRERDKAALELIHLNGRTMDSSFGEFTVKRRLYRDRRTEGYRFLLDEALGWGPRQRLTPRLEAMALELGTEMPFRRAAKVLDFLAPGVSAMTVWNEVQKAGEKAAREAKERREAVFVKGRVPRGSRQANKLGLEGDGLMVRAQRSKKRHSEVKLVVAYEGKTAGRRRSLENKRTVAGLVGGREIWEEAAADFGAVWDLSQVDTVRVGGDGAPWIREGAEMFNGEYHLDPFHLRKHLTEALASDGVAYTAVSEAMGRLDRAETMDHLNLAAKRARGAARRRILDLKGYLTANWDGLRKLPEEDRLGAIEGQVRHTISRRMKRIGARWTEQGADHMAKLLAAKSNGELLRYLEPRPAAVATDSLTEGELKLATARPEDVEAWLQAKVPALTGPFAGTPWIKHVLREIASTQRVA